MRQPLEGSVRVALFCGERQQQPLKTNNFSGSVAQFQVMSKNTIPITTAKGIKISGAIHHHLLSPQPTFRKPSFARIRKAIATNPGINIRIGISP